MTLQRYKFVHRPKVKTSHDTLPEKLARDAQKYWWAQKYLWRLLKLHRWGEKKLGFAEEQVTDMWPAFLLASALSGLGIALAVRAVHMLGELGGTQLLGLLSLIPGVVIAYAALVALVWGALNIRTPWRDRAYAVAFLSSAVATLVSVEAAAGITSHWRRYVLQREGITWADLWSAERFYLWHLVEMIPFVHPEQTLGWSEPAEIQGFLPRFIVLVLKVILALPLAQIFVSGYWWLRSTVFHIGHSHPTIDDSWPDRYGSSPDLFDKVGQTGFLWMLVTSIGGAIGLLIFWLPDAFLHQLLAEYLSTIIEIRPLSLSFRRDWIEDGVRLCTIACWIWVFGFYCLLQFVASVMYPPISLKRTIGMAVGIVLALVQAVVITATALYTLIMLCLAEVQPDLPVGAPIPALIEGQLWGLAFDVPVLEITKTLIWVQPYELSGFLAGVIVLSLKLFVIAALLLLILLPALYGTSSRSSSLDGGVNCAQRFLKILGSLMRLLRRAAEQEGAHKRSGHTYRDSRRWLADLDACASDVLEVFGPGEVSSLAKAAVESAKRHFDLVYFGPSGSEENASLDELADEFVRAAASALRSAIPDQKETLRSRDIL